MKDDLGGKGAGLAEMTNAGLPVPPGFTIQTEACRQYMRNGDGLDGSRRADGRRAQAVGRAARTETRQGENPLLVSVRSGAKFSMPGMMDTILNLGLNDETVEVAGQAQQQSALRLRLLSPLHPDVRQRGARNSQGTNFEKSSTPRRSRRRPSSTPTSTPRR